jgi:PAS domain-containing protein
MDFRIWWYFGRKKWSEDEINILQTLARNIILYRTHQGKKAIYESEEKFRLLANNIPGAVYLSKNDAKYTKIYLNDEIKKLTGYDKAEFLEKRVFILTLFTLKIMIEWFMSL